MSRVTEREIRNLWIAMGIFVAISLVGFIMWGIAPSTNPTALPDQWYPMGVLGIGLTGLAVCCVFNFRQAWREIDDMKDEYERNHRASSDS